jgi:hypothetical protein
MDKRQFHKLAIAELIRLRRDLYGMESKAIKTAKRVRVCLRAGNREQAEAHKAAATDMALIVDFLRGEIRHINSLLVKALAA